HSTINIQENTGMATFQASLVFLDGATNNAYVRNPKYTVDISPSKWSYDLLPSANIEGHYVVQDLQMMTKSKINFST
ncbi:hypothetical protein ACI3PL_32930, partial [Lacticaseibacillus paracasei]